jgi:hypothetical protein
MCGGHRSWQENEVYLKSSDLPVPADLEKKIRRTKFGDGLTWCLLHEIVITLASHIVQGVSAKP